MSDELKNRNIIVHLAAALSSGGAKGDIGSLDVSDVNVESLDWAITCVTHTPRFPPVTVLPLLTTRFA